MSHRPFREIKLDLLIHAIDFMVVTVLFDRFLYFAVLSAAEKSLSFYPFL